MTGIADLYLYLKRPYSKDRRKRLLAHVTGETESTARFVVLSWKRTGSNWLCGILHHHPQICMHNELFNPVDVFTYHPKALKEARWTVLTRDLFPAEFLNFIWDQETIESIRPNAIAVGFKSFPEHWLDARNEHVWHEHVLQDLRVKKIVLHREDELAVYVSMQRADQTGHYMTYSYPTDLKIHVDPAAFQIFVNNYRHTFSTKYQSPVAQHDTLHITYEKMMDEEHFEAEIVPKLWKFLGVDPSIKLRKLRETVKQADPTEDLSTVIANYDELEFCFRYTDVLHFVNKRHQQEAQSSAKEKNPPEEHATQTKIPLSSWSLLLPICSRPRASQATPVHMVHDGDKFDSNRFIDLALSSQHDDTVDEAACWSMLQTFADSLIATASLEQLNITECVVGIDVDDPVFSSAESRLQIQALLPCEAIFINIQPVMYGHVCKIWNHLAGKARNDFIVLLGDDVKLLDRGWQQRIVEKFYLIAREQKLPLGAACVSMTDLSFPGFPTFPVQHRWHMQQFGSLLPRQFSNQGGDPYLYELYSRFNAADFCGSCRLDNTIGGDGDARYEKHQINWRGQILNMNLRKLKGIVGVPKGIVLDVVVPSYRVNNHAFLERIAKLRATCQMYVRFWFILDNPRNDHIESVKQLANELNEEQLKINGNYFINVVHYGENRGASYARNTGYNYTTADWVLFLDDDVIPDENILDAYAGAIRRYPDSKVFVGMTELPDACGLWTEMLRACNVGYFYSIAKQMVHPSWGVTANLMVRGSRYNPTIQFKGIYPKTGGGEDIDFVWRFKDWYQTHGLRVTVGVPEAKAYHPWWNGGKTCYRQIIGWAWGDSLCITEWRKKTFLTLPNWIEHMTFLVMPLTLYTGNALAGMAAGLGVALLEHTIKGVRYFPAAKEVSGGRSFWRSTWVALGAGSVLSAQEITRTVALLRRGSWYSLCRRVDWFDGQKELIQLDVQLGSLLRFGVNAGLTWIAFGVFRARDRKRN